MAISETFLKAELLCSLKNIKQERNQIGNSFNCKLLYTQEIQFQLYCFSHPQHKHIMFDFTMVITLYHALELLTKHGSRVFLKFFEDHTDKTWVGKDNKLTSFLDNLRNSLGVNPFNIDQSPLPNGTIPEVNSAIFQKMYFFLNFLTICLIFR